MFSMRLNRNKRYGISIAMLLLALTTLSKSAQAVETLSLEQALKLTLNNNPTLHQFRFKDAILEAQKETDSQRPEFEISAEIENIAGSGNTSGFGAAESTIALSSVLEFGGKRQARISFADSRLEHYRWQQQAMTLDLLGDLTTTFIETLRVQANMALAQESLNLSQSLLKTAQSRSIRGATPEAEVKRAKAALVRAELLVTASESQFARQKNLLAQFWGSYDPHFTKLSGSLFKYPETESFDQLFKYVENSPSFKVFLTETRMQEANISLTKAKSRSDLNWQLGVRRFEDSNDTAIVAEFSIPLFTRQRNQGQLREAQAMRDAAQSAEKISLLRLRNELFQAFSLRAQSIDAVHRTKETAIPALESALELTRKAYLNGRYRYQDLIASQQELLQAKQALIDTAATALISQAVIEKLIGKPLNP